MSKSVNQSVADQPPTVLDRSIAVLPFLNLSSDIEQEYFSDGLADALLHRLAQIKDLGVAARTSSFKFKGQNVDIRDIAGNWAWQLCLRAACNARACCVTHCILPNEPP